MYYKKTSVSQLPIWVLWNINYKTPVKSWEHFSENVSPYLNYLCFQILLHLNHNIWCNTVTSEINITEFSVLCTISRVLEKSRFVIEGKKRVGKIKQAENYKDS